MPESAPSTTPPPLSYSGRGKYKRKRSADKDDRECYLCGKRKPVHVWLDPDSPVCHNCYQLEIRTGFCSECGNKKKISKVNDNGDLLCHACYQKSRPDEICDCCGMPGKIVRRLPNGRGIRSVCYQRERRKRLKASSNPS